MSKVTIGQKDRLKKHIGDDEAFHSVFDDILEEKLHELDPEWMTEMDKIYDKSDMARWCA